MVLRPLDIHLQKNEAGPPSPATSHKNELKKIKDLNVRINP